MNLAPFKAIRPRPYQLKSWVNRQIGEAASQNEDLPDFLSLIQPESNNTAQIRKRLHALLQQEVLVRDPNPSLYLLQIQSGNSKWLGFIGCVQTRKLNTGEIKPHEDIENSRIKTFMEYLKNTQLNAEPVVLCHPPNKELEEICYQFTNSKAFAEFERKETDYKLWRIDHPILIDRINVAFKSVDSFYIADGHHRCFSSLSYSKEDKTKDQFLAMLLPHDQLQIDDFCRMFSNLNEMRIDHFIAELSSNFNVERLSAYKVPKNAFEFSMYIGGSWFLLTSKRDRSLTPTLSRIPTNIIYEDIAKPLLNIQNLQKDKRISYIHYEYPEKQIKEAVDKGEFAFGLQHYPISFSEIVATVEDSDLLPPKSTHIKPKPLHGMLIFDFLSQ
jgi:uncharacterized protein (DUF1015 family)